MSLIFLSPCTTFGVLVMAVVVFFSKPCSTSVVLSAEYKHKHTPFFSMFAGRVRLVCVPPPPPCWMGEVVCVSSWTLTKARERDTHTPTGEYERQVIGVDSCSGASVSVVPVLLISLPIAELENVRRLHYLYISQSYLLVVSRQRTRPLCFFLASS